MRLLTILFFIVAALTAQTNPACPNASGPQPHCFTFMWNTPTGGGTISSYNLYTGGTTPGNCANVHSATCSQVGSVTGTPLVTIFTLNSTATVQYVEGTTYYFVVTAVNQFGESAPFVEAGATVPFVFMPTGSTALASIGH